MEDQILLKIPTLEEFEKTLYQISQEAAQAVSAIYQDAKEKGNLYPDGQMKDVCSIGSTIMILDRRKPLYKWLITIPEDVNKFYRVFVYGKDVRISILNIRSGQSYTMNYEAYEIVVKRLREAFGWEIYNNVQID